MERVELLFSLGYGAREVIQVFVVMMLRQCEVELATAGQEGSLDVVVTELR